LAVKQANRRDIDVAPERGAIGVELVAGAAERFPERPRPIRTGPHRDGAVADM
jgi:hypothetical protein